MELLHPKKRMLRRALGQQADQDKNMDHTKDHGAGGLSPRLGIQHQEPTSDSNEAVQASTINRLGLQLSVEMDHEGCTSRPTKKQSPTLKMEDTSTPSPSLQSRLQVSQLKSEIVEKPHVIAMENQISAYVPRRLILKEVMGQLNLNVHGTGMLPFGLDQYIAWMCVDLPRHGGRGKDGDTVLYSNPFSNHEDAEENLAESVLEYYQSNRKIEINDFNQNVLKKKQYELDISNFFCQAFEDKMDEMRAYPGTYSKMSAEQFYSEAFQDNMTYLIKERTTETNQCKAVHRRIADVCRSFSDILPIKEMCLPGDSSDAHSSQLTFTGDKENPSRVDQLALLLLDILRDGHIHAAKHGRFMH
ncbi:uncharacterized protein LOC120702706 isoform X2 [Panicum virgatum]|uniref:uncharacterized protein LOC120702706 isoform X2 n=2 Tax=Panicum virgatum TaxID=38727 RepID=UPI0019D57CA2|nr:uncharacterized protein LOC120702706 isoform X2 [Panicum virgatum]XP_039842545.1 uncharacterized protein LOC120702706 isoform X2 [Panicum virgatum]XP_039842546.1 uncharacterized protein LOC120702706 isoform X2 [Panicum virgatum]XP_039842547.1 uncharacterized protein LOC120702706 isoform X2 [Panicum virgatum]XP_039842548.1 uncharacterized protein LOC120702706 isoform X2 [Panicum virgatum]XP_039842549.1 uncharacterized protein LOC120702706 isoform X2 [Panicum virgatum]XP_039842550.1 uncharac